MGRAHHRRDQAIVNRHRDREIDILILHDRILIERRVHLQHLHRSFDRSFKHQIVHRDIGGVAPLASDLQLRTVRQERSRSGRRRG